MQFDYFFKVWRNCFNKVEFCQYVIVLLFRNYAILLISQDFTTQAIRLTDFLPAVFLLCMTFQKCEDLSFSSGTFINSF